MIVVAGFEAVYRTCSYFQFVFRTDGVVAQIFVSIQWRRISTANSNSINQECSLSTLIVGTKFHDK